MLKKLVETIEQVKSRMNEHGEYLEGLEWRTRIALIDPLLIELGWDVTNPEIVKLEHRIKKSRFDYAFCDENNKIRMIVEAKKFNDPLQSIEEQLGKYSLTTGVPYFLLTNGSKWILYNMDKSGKLEDRVEFEIKLQSESTSSAALSFLSIWRNAFLDTDPSQSLPKAKKSIFSKVRIEKDETQWLTLEKILQENRPWPPKQIRFPNSTIEAVDKLTFQKCLQDFIKFLFSVGKISTSDLPINLPNKVGGKLTKHVDMCLDAPSEGVRKLYSNLEWSHKTIWYYSNFTGLDIAKKLEVFANEYGVDQIRFSS